ncbi:MAG: L-threonylcarbamoyladenylate synthase [Candidatus Micrarchaeota archaeon]
MKTIATSSVKLAASFIRKGDIAAFPTETVYGLGADAFNARAAQKIFKAKNRPPDNPLIVHIHSKSQLHDVACAIPPKAQTLVEAFFPGPLTLVLKKSKKIPPIVTAGLPTVCVRMPSLPLARRFLRACGMPVAAPSANLSGRPSPTTWQHVLNDLGGRIPVILKGQSTQHGLESTIVDCTANPPVLLRPGAIGREELEAVIGKIAVRKRGSKAVSPGLGYRHYSPNAKVIIVNNARGLPRTRGNWAFIGFSSVRGAKLSRKVASPKEYARVLYSFFRQADQAGIKTIYAEMPQKKGIGLALADRISRASSPRKSA